MQFKQCQIHKADINSQKNILQLDASSTDSS